MALFDGKKANSVWKTAALAAGALGAMVLLWPSEPEANPGPESNPGDVPKSDDNVERTNGSGQLAVEEFNRRRLQRQRRGMGVLFGWSLVNIGTGTAGYFALDGPRRHFHGMNAMWNVVNAAIAGFGYVGARREDPAEGGAMRALDEAHRTEKVLLFNAGLNIGYIATGAFLWERGRRTDSDQLRGFGPSVAVQGLFLLGFDTAMYWLSSRHRQEFEIHVVPEVTDPGISATLRF